MQREKFSSRMGFLLISAGCAIGLGNVWRFPYITGQYGGAAFVLIYLFFLIILGLPIMVMEFSVGRASQKSAARSFDVLEPPGTNWHLHKYAAIAGNYLLMMFYTTVCGWMMIYFVKMLQGEFVGKNPEQVSQVFDNMLAQPLLLGAGMVVVVLVGFGICAMGLQNGVEKITKAMMVCLFLSMVVLVGRAVTLPGAVEGLKFYLVPDFQRIVDQGLSTVVFAAMGQSFFTLSIGIGSMAIFGSYISRERSLTGETLNIMLMDTFVALMAGMVIFPACSAFGISPGQGPSLVFVTLPNVFNEMPAGRFFGALFFVFMTFAALSTVIAVFENLVSFGMDIWGWSRQKTVLLNIFLVILLSLPCVLGFNLWSGIEPLGSGTTIQDLEDFIVSNNLLPLGSLVYLLFCTSKHGWGWQNFLREADAGSGIKFPAKARFYISYLLPLVVLGIFLQGYNDKFQIVARLAALFH